MTVELPKDADGREIPLDTVVLFSRDGHAFNIVRWSFITDFETDNAFANSWRAISENGLNIKPELMYLTKPDSWKKLLDDLYAAGDARHQGVCDYFNRDKDEYCCKSCPGCEDDCNRTAMRDIADRIRKLRGEE